MTEFWIVVLVVVVLIESAAIATSVYLHRALAHRSLVVNPIVELLLRAVLWLTTGQDRREWVASIASTTPSRIGRAPGRCRSLSPAARTISGRGDECEPEGIVTAGGAPARRRSRR